MAIDTKTSGPTTDTGELLGMVVVVLGERFDVVDKFTLGAFVPNTTKFDRQWYCDAWQPNPSALFVFRAPNPGNGQGRFDAMSDSLSTKVASLGKDALSATGDWVTAVKRREFDLPFLHNYLGPRCSALLGPTVVDTDGTAFEFARTLEQLWQDGSALDRIARVYNVPSFPLTVPGGDPVYQDAYATACLARVLCDIDQARILPRGRRNCVRVDNLFHDM